jgi:amino acid adenylation domain-containing protein
MGSAGSSEQRAQSPGLREADTFLYRRFELQVDLNPDAVAVRCGTESVSYAELNQRANNLAHELIEIGVVGETLVGLCAGPSIELITGMLAVMKAGGAYLPLDPAYPIERLTGMLQQARCNIVITAGLLSAELVRAFSSHASTVMALQPGNHKLKVAGAHNPQVLAEADDLCYVMFSSGSTGQPNGVMVSHANVAMLFENTQAALGFGTRDSWSALHSFGFGFSVWEIWGALTTGARLVIIPESQRADPVAWCDVIVTERVSVLSITPSGFRQLLLSDCVAVHGGLPDLRLVVFSGEPVSATDIDAWYELTGGTARLFNTYALTETAGRMTLQEYVYGQPASPVSIGMPVSDAEILLLDPDSGTPVAMGETGELFLGGRTIARGYLNNPELTAERFVELETGAGVKRFYRSGDLARLTPGGELEFAGRKDQQLKLRGHRIEPGDIEHTLREHPDIADAVVLVKEAGDVRQLTAFIVPSSGDAAASDDSPVEFWPSLGEYQVYDDLLYDFMSADEVRVASYNRAFRRQVADKVVLDIGTGKDAVLARLCAAAGARKVYAVEVLPDAAASARSLVAKLGLAERIEVICGDMQSITLPDQIDVCTQGIIGNIGSSDGIVAIWNDARHLCAESCVAIPERCTTLIAPAELPAEARNPSFSPLASRYAETIFAQSGGRFDVRLCVRNFPATGLLSQAVVFEDLDFNGALSDEYTGAATFRIERSGFFDGFLLWTRLYADADEVVDFFEHQQAWLPVWMPLCDEPVELEAGSTIAARWTCLTPAGQIFPDYRIVAELQTVDGRSVSLTYTTRHHETALNQTALHRSILSSMTRAESVQSGYADGNTPKNLPQVDYAAWLAQRLPDYMVPGRWVPLAQLPLNRNGKLDREALQNLQHEIPAVVSASAGSLLEKDIAAIWCDVLDQAALDIDADFFDAGGDSILAVRLTTEVQRYLDDTVFLAGLFDAPTIRSYAAWLQVHHAESVAHRGGNDGVADFPTVPTSPAYAPLSFAQQSLWFLQQLYPEHTGANEQFLIRIKGMPDPVRLSAAWESLLSRHDVFRSYIDSTGAQPRQQVHTPDDFARHIALPIVHLEGLDIPTALERLRADAGVQIAQPFRLDNAPLWRTSLYMMPGGEAALLVTVHHIIADGLCVQLVRDELAAAYAGSVSAPPEWQFNDFANWQRESMSQQWLDTELDWWGEMLRGHSGQPQSFGERPVGTVQAGHEVRVPFTLDAATGDRLRKLAKQEGATFFMLLLAAWRGWLTRCLDEPDLLIGSPATLRRDERTRRMLGCLVNNVVYRNPVTTDGTFLDLLAQERSNALAVYDHSTVPFEKIVEAFAPERVYGRHPLFQIMFMFEDRSAPAVQAEGLEFGIDVLTVDRASYWDIELSVVDHGAGEALTGFIGIRDDVYDAEALAWWVDGFAAMLQSIARDPGGSLATLPVQSAGQLQRTLVTWNATARAFPDQTLHALFERQAEALPDRIAVADEAQTLSYAGLNRLADSYAQGLAVQGIGPGVFVGISLQRSVTAVACLLAVLKRGAAWLPLDPNYPASRLRAMLSDAQPQLVICGADSSLYGAVKCLSADELYAAANENPAVNVAIASGDPAWLLYTSGSTGTPKGVIGNHATAVSRCTWMWEAYGFSDNDIFAQRTSFNFVDSIWEIFGALLHGARIEILPAALEADPAGLLDELTERRVTHLVVVPSLLHGLLDAAENRPHVSGPASVISSGEPLSTALATRVRQAWPACRLLNTYGTTETWDGSCFEVTAELPPGASVPVGTAVANARLYIVDRNMQPLPPGVVGELCVGGLAVGDGYLNQPELSTAKFTADPFCDEPDARIYHTGDRARFRGDGTVELLGRTDRQLKLRGLRIEPGDIEAQVLAYPGVAQCTVVLRSAPEVADWLCLYVVWRDHNHDDAVVALRSYLQARLLRPLVPADICVLERLPLLPNGKLDVAALPNDAVPRSGIAVYVAPRNDTEAKLAGIWAAALGAERVGVNDDFFALRGHSLLATRVIARVCEELAIDIPLQCLFENPTVEGLALQIDSLRWTMDDGSADPDSQDDREVVRI